MYICTLTMTPSLNESHDGVRWKRDSTRTQRQYAGLWRPNKHYDYCLITAFIRREYCKDLFYKRHCPEVRFLEHSKHLKYFLLGKSLRIDSSSKVGGRGHCTEQCKKIETSFTCKYRKLYIAELTCLMF